MGNEIKAYYSSRNIITISIFLFMFLIRNHAFSQTEIITNKISIDSVYKTLVTKNHITLTKENVDIKRCTFFYFYQNSEPYTFIFFADSAIKKTINSKLDLFQFIDENYSDLKKLNKYMITQKNLFNELANDSAYKFPILGIKYRKINNGHFPVINQEDCLRLNLIKYKEGFIFLERLQHLLESSITNKGNIFKVRRRNLSNGHSTTQK